ncbi:MAG: UvrD-helicase domain-containing protein [Limisphaerales bacterium]
MSAYTPQQQAAIKAAGRVVVLAGAGAGKTRVLVDRLIVRLLRADNPLSLDRVLVVTFTEAAAAEMRRRLADGLAHAQAERPGDPRPAEQLALLPAAAIGTIHAFCLRLVRGHFHALQLDPQLAVLDPAATRRLEAEVFQRLLRGHLARDASGPAGALLRGWLEGDAARLEELVLRLHRLARTLPNPATWLAGLRAGAADETPRGWLGVLPPTFASWADGWRPALSAAEAGTPLTRAATRLAALDGAPSAEGIFGALTAILAEDKDRTCWPKGRKTELRKPFEKFFREAAQLAGLLDPGAFEAAWGAARPGLEALYSLAAEFATGLAEAKREAAAVDFADLEQFTLRLLEGAAAEVAGRFDLLAVDEYQDVNEAQDRIIALLTPPAGERFLVGDLKQCIYRFRLANPRVLAGHAARTPPLFLSANFRSHEAILGFVNAAFARLFHRDLGGVEWDAGAALEFGAPEARAALRGDPAGRVEFHLLRPTVDDMADDAGEEAPADDAMGAEREARLVAWRLRRLRDEGFRVADEAAGGPRPAAWRDMVVLLRSPRGRSAAYAQEFARAGVPLDAPRGGFLEAREILDLRSLLTVLDNPRQDLPLVALLRSPLAGFTLDELAAVRLAARDEPWWAALRVAAHAADPAGAEDAVRAAVASAREKSAAILDAVRRWRRLAREGALTHALEVVLAETGYEGWLAAQPGGPARLANIRRLLVLTQRFDQHQRHGLYRFLRHLESLEDADAGPEQAPPPGRDAVRLMSIHAAKGLEFPVVVVAGLGGQFNDQDEKERFALDAELGLCPRVTEGRTGLSLDTLGRWLAQQRGRGDRLGEELRLLYVAVTRAVDKLILTAAPGARWRPAEAALPGPLPLRTLAAARTPGDWLGPLLGELAGDAHWHERPSGRGPWLDWSLHDEPPVPAPPAAAEPAPEGGLTAEQWEALRDRLAWRYPYGAATREPAKTSVTTLRRRWQAAAGEDEASARRFPGENRRFSTGAAEAGVAHHLFLERFDLAADTSAEALAAAADALVTEGWLRPDQRAALDFAGLAAFFAGDLGRRIRERAAGVEREVPFTFRLTEADAARLGGDGDAGKPGGEFQVVQGVADLVVRMPDEIWLVDFKTDDVPPNEAPARAVEYRTQVNLYALALEGIYGRPVSERWLWFLRARRGVRL